MTEDETVGWDHSLNGHEFDQTLVHTEEQGCLACYRLRGHKELDMTSRLNDNINYSVITMNGVISFYCLYHSLRYPKWGEKNLCLIHNST